jgi:transposase
MPKPVSPESTADVVANPEHDRRLRRLSSAEDKGRLLAEAEACTERGHLAELLRRDRLYSSQLATWRALLQREGEIEAKLPPGARRLRKQRPARWWPGG